jgi:hypothetical protein
MKSSFDALSSLAGGCARVGAVALLAGGLAWAQAPLPKDSPFLPAGTTSTTTPGETLEFAGISVVGNRTDLIFHDKATKKTSWVRLGATANGISALKYDAKLEQAVVRVNGVEKVLTLRKGSGPLNAPMPTAPALTAAPPVPPANPAVQILPAPAPTGATPAAAGLAPATPATPDATAKQETEARMLVSDLLEIGMAQRKAYEEAQQRKAAEQNGAVGPGTAPVPPVPGAPATPPLPVAQPPAPPPQPPPQQN